MITPERAEELTHMSPDFRNIMPVEYESTTHTCTLTYVVAQLKKQGEEDHSSHSNPSLLVHIPDLATYMLDPTRSEAQLSDGLAVLVAGLVRLSTEARISEIQTQTNSQLLRNAELYEGEPFGFRIKKDVLDLSPEHAFEHAFDVEPIEESIADMILHNFRIGMTSGVVPNEVAMSPHYNGSLPRIDNHPNLELIAHSGEKL